MNACCAGYDSESIEKLSIIVITAVQMNCLWVLINHSYLQLRQLIFIWARWKVPANTE